jgi:hypothetical protein
VEITEAVAADLAALTQALDDPEVDLTATLHQLVGSARRAVRSFLGLTVMATVSEQHLRLTALEDALAVREISASLMIPLQQPAVDGAGAVAGIDLILYAGTPGAFIDLAADLAWLSKRPLVGFVLDQHLVPPGDPDASDGLAALSSINQAIGALIARGRTPEQAERELDALAANAGLDRYLAATQILGATNGAAPDAHSSSP